MADDTQEKIVGTKTVLSIYRKVIPARGTSFDIVKVARLQYLDIKMDYFGAPLFWAQGA